MIFLFFSLLLKITKLSKCQHFFLFKICLPSLLLEVPSSSLNMERLKYGNVDKLNKQINKLNKQIKKIKTQKLRKALRKSQPKFLALCLKN